MIQLPEVRLTADEQRDLATLAATITPARALLTLDPSNTGLWRAIRLGLLAEHILWTANLRLVMRIAVDVASRRGEGLDDLFQEGCLALQEAIRRFDPSLGFRLSSYAHELITRRVLATESSTTVWVGASKHFQRVRRRIESGEIPRSSARAGMALAQLVDVESMENLADPEDPFERVDETCVEMIEFAEPRFRELLRLRFGFDGPPHQHADLAERFGVSRTTISRWERRALQQIRDAIEESDSPAQPRLRPGSAAAGASAPSRAR